jgi:hypothetical protein
MKMEYTEQDDIIAELTQNFIVKMHEGPLGKFQGTPEYDVELMKQINRIGKLFNISGNVI